MFIYPIYPVPKKIRKKTARHVESISRTNNARKVGYGVGSDLLDRVLEARKIMGDNNGERAGNTLRTGNWNEFRQHKQKTPTGELYILNAMPILLEWRRPIVSISPDYIQKHRDRLNAAKRRQRPPISR